MYLGDFSFKWPVGLFLFLVVVLGVGVVAGWFLKGCV